MLKELGEPTPSYKIRDMIKEVDLDENGTVEFDEFLTVRSREAGVRVCSATATCELCIPRNCSA